MHEVGGGLEDEVIAGHSRAAHVELSARIVRGEGNWWRAQPEEPLRGGGGVMHIGASGSGQIAVRAGGAGRGLENEWRGPGELQAVADMLGREGRSDVEDRGGTGDRPCGIANDNAIEPGVGEL